MTLLPVYARRVEGRVVLFRDALCTEIRLRYQAYKGPRRNTKTVILNCFRWEVIWIPT
jgi:hypothetical protein